MHPDSEPAAASPPETAIGPTPERWLEACRAAVEANREIFAEHPSIEARTAYEGIGEGGDRTLVIDRLCEDAVFDQLERIAAEGHSFLAVSEERGEVRFGDGGGDLRVVIDPIDGSLNARRMVPQHSLSIAVASGDAMSDVQLGFVHEFGAGEEFTAIRGQGARWGDSPLRTPRGDGLEVVAMEAGKPERAIEACRVLEGRAYRLRAPGSIAISLAYVAAGRFDGMFSTRPTRSVDAAAAQLIVTEAGGHVHFGADARLDLDARFGVAGARTPSDLEVLVEAWEAVR